MSDLLKELLAINEAGPKDEPKEEEAKDSKDSKEMPKDKADPKEEGSKKDEPEDDPEDEEGDSETKDEGDGDETLDEVFDAGEKKTYISKERYEIKKLEHGERVKTSRGDRVGGDDDYFVRVSDGRSYVISSNDLTDYKQINDGDEPDAEGFTKYRAAVEFDIVEYKGEAKMVKVGDAKKHLANGNLIAREPGAEDNAWIVKGHDAVDLVPLD